MPNSDAPQQPVKASIFSRQAPKQDGLANDLGEDATLNAEEFAAKVAAWRLTWTAPRQRCSVPEATISPPVHSPLAQAQRHACSKDVSVARWLPTACLAEVKHQRGSYLPRLGALFVSQL